MGLQLLDISSETMLRLTAAASIAVLLFLLIASFVSRSRVFCQYLRHMTGIELKPSTVQRLYKKKGRSGVRDFLIDLLIREDLADPSRKVVTPDSKPDTSIFDSDVPL
jgi:hypothetical protein